eukprot:TRINITY_DN17213_c0_g4_i3.p1 TRINITY_DN17213_c0_g4~~TRINITY_DN17213_c0_g4_i3.p1  ORF type:complete len:187 (+),score=67.75 TRINITY_DN17213_c0_g4_i3:88-648(+)
MSESDEEGLPPIDFEEILSKASGQDASPEINFELKAEIDKVVNNIFDNTEPEDHFCRKDPGIVQETKETEGNSFYEKVVIESEMQLDQQWSMYLDESKNSLVNSRKVSEEVKDLLSERCSFISEKRSIVKNEKTTIPRLQSTFQMKFSATPLYDLLLRQFSLHSKLVNEYQLSEVLAKNEKLLENK